MANRLAMNSTARIRNRRTCADVTTIVCIGESLMDYTAGITLGIAIAGMVLGIINTWMAANRDKIRLKVIPRFYVSLTGQSGLCVEVINQSYLPVTLTRVGFMLRRPRRQELTFIPQRLDQTTLPKRMEPLTNITLYPPDGFDQDERLREAVCVVARTACGRTFRGNTPGFKAHIKNLRAAAR